MKAAVGSLGFLERKQRERRIHLERGFLIEERVWAEKVSLSCIEIPRSLKVVTCGREVLLM